MDNQTKIKILKQARELLTKPNGWIKGIMAKNREGYIVHPFSPIAVSFCALGACRRALFNLSVDTDCFNASLSSTKDLLGIEDLKVANLNDSPDTTLEDVLALYDNRIKELETE